MTKRELTLIGITVLVMCIPLAIVAHKNQQPEMTSSIFDWTTIKARPTKTGESRPFFQAPTPTLDELECHVTTLNPGESPHAPHKHPDEELIIIREGTVESLVNGVVKRVGPGSVIFQSSNQLHSIKNVGTTQATYHVVKWKTAKTPAAGN
jgi:quercetin dioxygenase-like cupin family protein